MTEREWLECNDPMPMLEFLRGKVSDRKLRLFACACVRHIWHLLDDERLRGGVEVAERFADGLASEAELMASVETMHHKVLWPRVCRYIQAGVAATNTAHRVIEGRTWLVRASQVAEKAAFAAAEAIGKPHESSGLEGVPGYSLVRWPVNGRLRSIAVEALEEAACQSVLLREVVGSPFRSMLPEPNWLAWSDGTVTHMAHTIYDARAFDCLPILADALEDAGCTDPDILDHLRGPGPHVRGCWPVDLLLGKK